MSVIKWWLEKHSVCAKCQKRWKKMKRMFGIKGAPGFVKVKAETDEEVKDLMELLFGKVNGEKENGD